MTAAKKAKAASVKAKQTATRAEYVEKAQTAVWLGEVVCWKTGKAEHEHPDVLAALTAAGLDSGVARELAPRDAFSRAAKKMGDDRVIDVAGQTRGELTFQFTRRYVEEQEWRYTKDCLLTLDKQTGRVRCPTNPELEATAQRLVDRATETRTAADVSRVIQKLFEREADLFPVREQGGVYFVPDRHKGFADRIAGFLAGLGGELTRFPVPAGVPSGEKAVQDAVMTGLAGLVAELDRAVEGFGADTRLSTFEAQAGRVVETRVKVQAYAQYLGDRQAEMLAAVAAAEGRLRTRVKELGEARRADLTVSVSDGRLTAFGHPVTALLRWMGKAGWSRRQARWAVDKLIGIAGGGAVSDATVATQVIAGRQGDSPHGKPADLGPEQVKRVEALIADCPTDPPRKAEKKEDKPDTAFRANGIAIGNF